MRRSAIVLILLVLACGDELRETTPVEPAAAPEAKRTLVPPPALPDGTFDVGPLLDTLPDDPMLAKAPGEAYERLLAKGIRNLHYAPCDRLLGNDGEATVDGVHPTDLGFYRFADALAPLLRRILNEPKGQPKDELKSVSPG